MVSDFIQNLPPKSRENSYNKQPNIVRVKTEYSLLKFLHGVIHVASLRDYLFPLNNLNLPSAITMSNPGTPKASA